MPCLQAHEALLQPAAFCALLGKDETRYRGSSQSAACLTLSHECSASRGTASHMRMPHSRWEEY